VRVLHLITGLRVGGTEKFLLKLLPRLTDEHVVCSVLNLRDIGDELEAKGIRVYYLGFNYFNLPIFLWRFYRVVQKERPDLLNCWLIHSNLFGRVFGRLCGVKKVICCVQNKHITRPLLNWLDARTSFLVNKYVPNSPAIVPFMVESGINRDKIQVIPGGVEISKYDINVNVPVKKKELGLNSCFVIGSVARLEPQKRLDTLIEAFSNLGVKDSVLILVGDGSRKVFLQKLANRLSVMDKVKFLGTRDDVPELLKTFDVFVLPSYYEGMSNSILEAMAARRAIVVSDIEENTTLIKDGINGLVFKVGDSDDLVSKLRCLHDEPKLIKECGERAFRVVKERYSLERIAEQYLDLWREELRGVANYQPGDLD